MTSREIIGGVVAVAVFLAFIASVGLTNGWSFFLLVALIVLGFIFVIGAALAGGQ
jgi:hypothetical protein